MADYLNVIQKSSSDSSYSLAPLASMTNSVSASIENSVTGFSDVIFIGVSEVHAADTDLVCKFSVRLPPENVHPSDIIGLYPIGWTSVHEHACSQPISASLGVSSSSRAGNELVNSVIFKAENLPRDDGEFYQLCYISHSSSLNDTANNSTDPNNISSSATSGASNSTQRGHVRGASIPFQLIEDDFEILDQPSLTSLIMKSPSELIEKYGGPSGVKGEETSDPLTKSTTSSTEVNQSTGSNTVMGQSNEASASYVTVEQSTGSIPSNDGVGQDTGSGTDWNRNTVIDGSKDGKISDFSHDTSKQTDRPMEAMATELEHASVTIRDGIKQVEQLADRPEVSKVQDDVTGMEMVESLRVSESERRGLELRLEEMEIKMRDKDKKLTEVTRSLESRNDELRMSRSQCQELEAALFALGVAKETLAERIVKQDRERSRLFEQIKRTTVELDQLKMALTEYKKASSAKRNVSMDTVESSATISTTTAAAAAAGSGTDNNEPCTLMYRNPYEHYLPAAVRGTVYQQFDQFT